MRSIWSALREGVEGGGTSGGGGGAGSLKGSPNKPESVSSYNTVRVGKF